VKPKLLTLTPFTSIDRGHRQAALVMDGLARSDTVVAAADEDYRRLLPKQWFRVDLFEKMIGGGRKHRSHND